MTETVLGVIQARMGSSRVPGKALADLAGQPLIGHMIDRMRDVPQVDEIVLATTEDPRNDPLVAYCAERGLRTFRHPEEDDLAGRIAGAIRGTDQRLILKTGGDCPFIDPAVLRKMVETALAAERADFVSNRVQWSYPLGLSADVVSRSAVEWADATLTAPEDRELFAVYIRDHPERFAVIPVVHDTDLSHHNWCVDTPEDLAFARRVFDALYPTQGNFGMQAVLDFLETERA